MIGNGLVLSSVFILVPSNPLHKVQLSPLAKRAPQSEAHEGATAFHRQVGSTCASVGQKNSSASRSLRIQLARVKSDASRRNQ
jgi:hypothetical protein